MQTRILHLVWQPKQTTTAASLWNDILLQCAAQSPYVEPCHPYEAFVDLTDACRVENLLCALNALQKEGESGTFILSLAPNKFIARTVSLLALENALPPSLHVHQSGLAVYTETAPSQAEALLASLSVRCLWCIDRHVRERLVALGITKIGELRRVPLPWLVQTFGAATGQTLFALANGRDDSPVQPLYPPRTVEVYWDFPPEQTAYDMVVFDHVLRSLTHKLAGQLHTLGLACSSLLLRVESPAGVVGQAGRLDVPSCTSEGLAPHVERLFRKIPLDDRLYRLHLIAGDLSLPESKQTSFISSLMPPSAARVDKVLAGVRKRFGAQAIQCAGTLKRPRREQMRALWHGTS